VADEPSSQAASYFPNPIPRLVALLDNYLASLAASLRRAAFCPDVCVLLLGGGYGRGEGGVFLAFADAEPQLYNDLEFYLILHDDAKTGCIERWCVEQAHRGEELLGIEVEFKILREGPFRAGQPSMFYYDLLAAHRVVWGPPDFARSVPEQLRDPALIPLHEATRLLFNRGSGLFFSYAGLHLRDGRVADGFIERNHAKVRLALADAVLAAHGRYHFSCRERRRRVLEYGMQGAESDATNPHSAAPSIPRATDARWDVPPDWNVLMHWHAQGVEFKLNPRHRHPSVLELERDQELLCQVWMRTFLWLESRRLNARFACAPDYARFRGRLFPHTSPLINFMLHWRDRLRRGGALPCVLDYPRGVLQRALVLLLQPEADTTGAARFLNLKTPFSFEDLEAEYMLWWRFYN